MMYHARHDALHGNTLFMETWAPAVAWEPLHYHISYELGLALSGRGLFRVEDREYPAEPGDIFVQSSYRGHIAQNDIADGCNYIFMYFRPEFVLGGDDTDHLVMETFHPALPSRIEAREPEAAAVAQLMKEAFRLYQTSAPTRNLLIKARIIEAIASIHDHFERSGALVLLSGNRKGVYLRLLSVLEFVRNNIGSNLSSEILAGQMNLSPSRFEHLFTELTGISPARYLRKVRMERARELLMHSDFSIKQVAYEVGLSPVRMTRQFKLTYGANPQQYCRSGTAPR